MSTAPTPADPEPGAGGLVEMERELTRLLIEYDELKTAWPKGGHSRALIAVFKGANRSKLDRDPASWLPPNRSYWCKYLEDWVSVKRKWGLSMDTDEVAAVQKGFSVCGRYRVGDKLEGHH